MGNWHLARFHTVTPPLRKGHVAHINSGGGGVAEPATLPHHHTQTLRKFTEIGSWHLVGFHTTATPLWAHINSSGGGLVEPATLKLGENCLEWIAQICGGSAVMSFAKF